jgi:hypothetical protein
MATRDGTMLVQQQVEGACCLSLAEGSTPNKTPLQSGHAISVSSCFDAASRVSRLRSLVFGELTWASGKTPGIKPEVVAKQEGLL